MDEPRRSFLKSALGVGAGVWAQLLPAESRDPIRRDRHRTLSRREPGSHPGPTGGWASLAPLRPGPPPGGTDIQRRRPIVDRRRGAVAKGRRPHPHWSQHGPPHPVESALGCSGAGLRGTLRSIGPRRDRPLSPVRRRRKELVHAHQPRFAVCRNGSVRVLKSGRILAPLFAWVSPFAGGESEQGRKSLCYSWTVYSDDDPGSAACRNRS